MNKVIDLCKLFAYNFLYMRNTKKIIFTIFVVALIIFISFFIWNNNKHKNPLKNKVSASIFPIFDIIKNIAGESINVVLISPAGSSPHTYEPKPEDIKNVTGSSAVFTIGHNLDNFAVDIARAAEIQNIIIVDKKIDLKTYEDEHSHAKSDNHNEEEKQEGVNSMDPHYWLSIPNGILIAQQVSSELSLLYPEKTDLFKKNLQIYEKRLLSLEAKIQSEIAPFKGAHIATFHNAWSYFAKNYSLEIATTFEEFPGVEPSPQYLKSFINEIKLHNVKAIFSEPQFSTKALEPIASDLNIQISTLDPIGASKNINSYESLLEYNILQIKTVLNN